MFAIYLDVGFQNQLSFGNPADPTTDPTGCWYASICMIGYYFEYGPRLGNPALYKRNLGTYKDGTPMIGNMPANAKDMTVVMKNEHLVALPEPAGKAWATPDLAQNLRTYGPLAFAWKKTANGHTYGHVSVLIGADGAKNEIVIHDPENRPNFHMSTSDFNKQLLWGFPSGSVIRREDGEFRMKGGLYTGSVKIEMEAD
jgi:hypothetical protein